MFYDTTRPLYLKTRVKTLSGSGSAKKAVSEADQRDSMSSNQREGPIILPIMAAFLGVNPYKTSSTMDQSNNIIYSNHSPLAVQPFIWHDHIAVKATVFEIDYPIHLDDHDLDGIDEVSGSGGGIGGEGSDNGMRASFLQKNPLANSNSKGGSMIHEGGSTQGGNNPLLQSLSPMTSPMTSRGYKDSENQMNNNPMQSSLPKTKHQYRRVSAMETSIVTPKLSEARSPMAMSGNGFGSEGEFDVKKNGKEGIQRGNSSSDGNNANSSGFNESSSSNKKTEDSTYFSGGGGEHGRVVILWNECVQQFGPNSEQWSMYGLGDLTGPAKLNGMKAANKFMNKANQYASSSGGKSGVSTEAMYHTQAALQASQVAVSSGIALYIIIDPLSGGLYRTRLYRYSMCQSYT